MQVCEYQEKEIIERHLKHLSITIKQLFYRFFLIILIYEVSSGLDLFCCFCNFSLMVPYFLVCFVIFDCELFVLMFYLCIFFFFEVRYESEFL